MQLRKQPVEQSGPGQQRMSTKTIVLFLSSDFFRQSAGLWHISCKVRYPTILIGTYFYFTAITCKIPIFGCSVLYLNPIIIISKKLYLFCTYHNQFITHSFNYSFASNSIYLFILYFLLIFGFTKYIVICRYFCRLFVTLLYLYEIYPWTERVQWEGFCNS